MALLLAVAQQRAPSNIGIDIRKILDQVTGARLAIVALLAVIVVIFVLTMTRKLRSRSHARIVGQATALPGVDLSPILELDPDFSQHHFEDFAFRLFTTAHRQRDLQEKLSTLSQREWAAGFTEALKSGLLAGDPLWGLIRKWPSTRGEDQAQATLIRRAAALKNRVVAADPKEAGERAILNLGHTIGHGVEHAAAGRYLHGEAIAIGLVAALALSVEHAGLDSAVADEVTGVLTRQGLPTVAEDVSIEAVLDAMRSDKKRSAGRTKFVLLEAPGRAVWGVDLDDTVVEAAVAAACNR